MGPQQPCNARIQNDVSDSLCRAERLEELDQLGAVAAIFKLSVSNYQWGLGDSPTCPRIFRVDTWWLHSPHLSGKRGTDSSAVRATWTAQGSDPEDLQSMEALFSPEQLKVLASKATMASTGLHAAAPHRCHRML